MASQIAHIIYCQKYFAKYPSKINKDEFMLGSIFPDIRRIDEKIKRKDTHLCFPAVNLDFKGLSAFEAGWKFHLYCDMRREEILNSYNLYSIKGASDFWCQPTKLLEDELVYEQYENWEKLGSYFNNVNYAGSLVSRETASLWYAINAKYFEKKPDSKTMSIFLSKLPALSGIAGDIIKITDDLKKNKKVMEILNKVKDEII